MAEVEPISEWLAGCVRARLDDASRGWFDDRLAALRGGGGDGRELAPAFAMAPRRVGKADLAPAPAELAGAGRLRAGWDPGPWSLDQAARLAFLLATYRAGDDPDGAAFAAGLEALFATADVGEAVCLLRGLPLYPAPERHLARARDGARSGMRPVFEAVAHRNPYPRERFDEPAWNQLVVKALFVGSALDPIQGIDGRRNPELARMLVDYARERRAAGRPVSPELWRCVGPFADAGLAAEFLVPLLAAGEPDGARRAAARALLESAAPEARDLLARHAPDLLRGVPDPSPAASPPA